MDPRQSLASTVPRNLVDVHDVLDVLGGLGGRAVVGDRGDGWAPSQGSETVSKSDVFWF